ncbi:MAG: serine hydroxymethyltransferase, partial [Planctomycetota bacterium]|nr:serine hydroxymethyltransferase [Planctomycetota bacterium]
MTTKTDFLFKSNLSSIDPDTDFLIRAEEERQRGNLLMIASESLCPRPVREALTTVFSNKYAEGYPSLRMTRDERQRIEKEPERYLAFHRRYGDRRFYKGAEFCNFIEVLAQRRAAELFANSNADADEVLVNVQPLSGAAANNAVFNAFLTPGDVMMGMSLSHGGHLTHGSPFNRSGRQYKVIPYTVNPENGQFDYALIEKLALEHKPKIIIAGASAYPWTIDWAKLKAICEKVPVQIAGLNQSGALLMADISHPAGLVVAGLFPNPVGIADITTLTTHKTLCGPRGAIIISTDDEIARRIDLGVFPGEQGGPHLNQIAAKSVCFKIAATKQFRTLQKKIIENCQALADEFSKLGLPLAYGGTNTHLLLIDLGAMKTSSGIPLSGDVASNILDLCGITVNKNALPGDETGARPRGLRFGTTIVSQLGMGKLEMKKIAHLVHYVLTNIKTFTVISHSGEIVRGKIDLKVMEKTRAEVDKLVGRYASSRQNSSGRRKTHNALEISGERATAFLQSLVSANLYMLKPGQAIQTALKVRNSSIAVVLKMVHSDTFLVIPPKVKIDTVFRYFRGLSDGYILFPSEDIYAKVEGPVVIRLRRESSKLKVTAPYLIRGSNLSARGGSAYGGKPETFVYKPYTGAPRKTALYEEHQKLTKPQFIVPFAGYLLPLWYTRASEEHLAVRTAAGLFDVSHMGKLQISGPYATRFLDLVTTNYVPKLKVGQSHYSYILSPDGEVMDDILLYRLADLPSGSDYLMVVNAVNTEKIRQYLSAVNNSEVIIDKDNPEREIEDKVTIIDRAEVNPLVNIALQGPNSLKILLHLTDEPRIAKTLRRLRKTHFIYLDIKRFKLLIARTGYTGEEMGFEIFVSKEQAGEFWNLLLETGKSSGLKPCGLAARDSLRTEAGLPLYGHELSGNNVITPTQAGYGAFIKRHKPFFIGRKAYLKKEKALATRIVRFKVTTSNARAIKPGNKVILSPDVYRGGVVTSCVLAHSALPPARGEARPEGRQERPAQVGMALINKEYSAEGTKMNILPTSKQDSQLAGEPVEAVILSRFPRPVRGEIIQ